TVTNLIAGYKQGKKPPKAILENINVSLHAGELVCLLGPNGSGKSTLMRTIAHIQPALSGDVHLMGHSTANLSAQELAKCISIVLTERVNAGNLSVYGLIALGRYPYTNWIGDLTANDKEIIHC